MSYEAFASTPVIITAFAALFLGVAGTKAWNWLGDWWQARMLDFSIPEFIWCRRRRVDSTARARAALLRSVLAKLLSDRDLGDSGIPSSVDESPVVESAIRGTDPVSRDGDEYRGESAVPVAGSQQFRSVSPQREIARNTNKIRIRDESPADARHRPARVIVSTADQIREFLVFELARAAGRRIKREYSSWYEAYLRWADLGSIEHMPQCIFLKLLGKAPGVEKSIDRLKDPSTGRVVKNDAGTPVRVYSYILGDPIAVGRRGKRETRQQKMSRESAEVVERLRLADMMPDQSWPEFLASMPERERAASGLEDLYRKIAA